MQNKILPLLSRCLTKLIQLRIILLLLAVLSSAPVAMLFVQHNFQQKDAAMEAVQRDAMWTVRAIAQKHKGVLLLGKRFLIDLSRVPAIRELNVKEANTYLSNIIKTESNFYTLGVIDSSGIIQASYPASKGISVSERAYYKKCIETQDFAVGEFAFSKITGKKSIHMAYPILNNGVVTSMLFAAFDVESFGDMPEVVQLSDDSCFLVTDRKGTVLHAWPHGEAEVGDPLTDDLWLRIKDSVKDEGSFRLKGRDEIDRIYSFKRLVLADKRGDFYFIVGNSVESAYSKAFYDHNRHLMALIGTTLIAIAMAWVAGSRFIVRHTQKISEAASQLAEGDFTLRLPETKFYGEFSLISKAFNNMAKRLEERSRTIREKEQIYRSLFESAGDAILMLYKGRVVRANKATSILLRMEPNDLIHLEFKSLLATTPLDSMDGTPIALDFSAGGERRDRVLMTLYRRDRTVVEVEATISGVEISQAFYIQIILHDISEQRAIEKAKKSIEEEYQQAKKMESIGQLAGGVAHDFNNLLTVISGNLALARMSLGAKDPNNEILGEAEAAAERASSLTRQLLAFSRRQIIAPKVVQLNDLIVNIKKMLDRLIGENIRIETQLDPTLKMVRIDPSMFEQVIVNLSVNARDAMSNGGVLRIETQRESFTEKDMEAPKELRGKSCVKLIVSDSGCGMSPEVQQRIFEPFYSTKPMGKGTGLGLAMVFGTVKQAGGVITVESIEMKGSSFIIYLPEIDPEMEEISEGKLTELIRGGKETILLVEDEESLRLLTTKMLQRIGYSVVDACNGEQALELLKDEEKKIDLLMTDVVMPGMNGRELAEKIAHIRPGIKVLFASGYTEDVMLQHGLNNGSVHFIPKPFSLTELAKKVREVLS